MDASGPGVPPLDKAEIVLNLVYFKPLASINQSASFSLTPPCLIIGSPLKSCSLAHVRASSMSEPLASPTASLSFIKVVMATFQPSPISPNLCESGILTSLKYTSLKPEPLPADPVICLMGLTSIPGDFISTKKKVRPLCFSNSGSCLTTKIPKSE